MPVVSVNKAHSQTLQEHMLKDAEEGKGSFRNLGKSKISLINLKVSVEKIGNNIFSPKKSDSEESKFEFELNDSYYFGIEEVTQLSDFQDLDGNAPAVSDIVFELMINSPIDDQFPELAPGPPIEIAGSPDLLDWLIASPAQTVISPPIFSFLPSLPDKSTPPEFVPWDISEEFSGEAKIERIPESSISPLIWVGVVAMGWFYGKFNSKDKK
ncbi:MAG: hypothetical protein F6J89_21155 [Symploca sp. SIO1C4]|uniref:Uncharacterized protein n=1 Tax=Symploca sp. SIO1C4 TaxID=2607765 RepID=A0A6B3N8W5_9CYAN|nr:hypothetical protein [Symploca sp. SIO1C4]